MKKLDSLTKRSLPREDIRWEALSSIAKEICPNLRNALKRGSRDTSQLEGAIIGEIRLLKARVKQQERTICVLKDKIENLTQVSIFDLLDAREKMRNVQRT